MSDQKINFCNKFAIKHFRATVSNADTGGLKSLHTIFDTYLDHMLARFEPNRVGQNVQNFQVFDQTKNPSFLLPFLSEC